MASVVWYPAIIIGCVSMLALPNDTSIPIGPAINLPSWWVAVVIALVASWWMPLPPESSRKMDAAPTIKAGNSSDNTWMISSVADRKMCILRVAIAPIMICFLAFTRSAIMRMTTTGPYCRSYGWFNNASSLTKCDHKPLDVHASLALIWLAAFSVQVCALLLMDFNKGHAVHKKFGRIGFGIASINVGAMLLLAYSDQFHPMPGSHRPPAFAPMMFGIAVMFAICLLKSYQGIMARDLDAHMVWMYRAFIATFSTPMIRFYPLLLRRLIGTECVNDNLDRLVMSSTSVAGFSCWMLFTIVQYKTQPKVWDSAMITATVMMVLLEVRCISVIGNTGSFLTGMIQCKLGLE